MSKTRCQPRYFPQPGHEDTITHDGRKDGRYYVVGAGHCGNGVFTDPKIADRETDGFSGYEKRSTKRWTGINGVEEIWASYCDRLHRDGCHTGRLPDGWDAPVAVVHGCAPPTRAAAAAASERLAVGERLVNPLVFPAPATSASPAPPAPHTPQKSLGSGNTWASPLIVRSSASPSPLRPPPHYSQRAALNPNGSSASTSAGSSVLSAISSSTSVSSSSSASAQTPKKTTHSRVQSSPNADYDTDFYYDDDSDDENAAPGPSRMSTGGASSLGARHRDSAFDALRQNMDRLRYMEIRAGRSSTILCEFAAS
ncbi:hypothetical protein C8F04DRAFT_1199092 [Mycena alexandri]|uniref:Uncharacterized protein n=1 Tax=Mycena alexandri TaxID=1745969 RepID=A0AAD6WRJ2_9AGAR|nr:hypothetical protein C8F04DRAFT_1199092 [Mycena alexandri]